MTLNSDTGNYEEPVPLIDQPSPRSTFLRKWKAPFSEIKGTFYDSDLEEDPESGPATTHHRDPAHNDHRQDEHLADVVEQNTQQSMNPIQRSHYVERPEERGFSAARKKFQKTVRHVSEKVLTTEDHFELEKNPLVDPTHTIRKFLKETIKRGRAPLHIVLKQHNIKSLDLTGLGIGDDYGVALSKTLSDFQHLSELLLSDNRLSDHSLVPILEGARFMNRLVHLELHHNDMDRKGAEALRNLLCCDTVNIEYLTLNHTDVDDEECVLLMDSLQSNSSLRSLHLSNNLIGQAESLNTCKPNLITGPEATAGMLLVNTTLTHLDLSWNSIRGASAIALAQSLADNCSLKYLNLANNSFAEYGSQYIGRSLLKNTALQTLDLSYNQINAQGAMVVATAIKKNTTLQSLILDGNVVGRIGSEHLISSIRENASSGHGFKLSLAECDVVHEDPTVFDMQYPTKPDPLLLVESDPKKPLVWGYVLDLAKPYDYMVASELLHLANSKEGCQFTAIKHEYWVGVKKRRRLKKVDVKLKRGSVDNEEDSSKMACWRRLALNIKDCRGGDGSDFDVSLLEFCLSQSNLNPTHEVVDFMVNNIHEKIEVHKSDWDEELCWTVALQSVFEFVDKDKSGHLDCDEMLDCLAEIGVTPSRESVKQVIAEYDVDDTGVIEEEEFVAYMLHKYAAEAPKDKPDLVEAKSGKIWEVREKSRVKSEATSEGGLLAYMKRRAKDACLYEATDEGRLLIYVI